jgi:hypothetical protein
MDMTDYQIQPHTRRCTATGRELRPGETFYSVLRDEGGKFVRQDYAAEAWQGPPPGAFSFWQGRLPAGSAARRHQPIDDDLLTDCFTRLEGETEPGRVNFRYVLALLLMRRRRFRFEEASQEGGKEILRLRCTRTGARYEVVNPGLTDEEMDAVQEDVFQALGRE